MGNEIKAQQQNEKISKRSIEKNLKKATASNNITMIEKYNAITLLLDALVNFYLTNTSISDEFLIGIQTKIDHAVRKSRILSQILLGITKDMGGINSINLLKKKETINIKTATHLFLNYINYD
eukprot:Pgem_evm1s5161